VGFLTKAVPRFPNGHRSHFLVLTLLIISWEPLRAETPFCDSCAPSRDFQGVPQEVPAAIQELRIQSFFESPVESVCRTPPRSIREPSKAASSLLLPDRSIRKIFQETKAAVLEAAKTRLNLDKKSSGAPAFDAISQQLQRVQILSLSEYESEIAKLPPQKEVDLTSGQTQVRESFQAEYQRIKPCGQKGEFPSAFQNRSLGWIVLCPGLIERAKALSGRDPELLKSLLVHSMAHELGHSLDSDEFPNWHQKLRNCLISSQADLAGRFAGKDRKFDVERRLSEVSTDHWAIEALVKNFRSRKLPREAALQHLKTALFDQCGKPGTPPYPSGQFRIEGIVAGNRSLRSFMKMPVDPKSCF
jgi:hypothetical protein